VGGDEFAVIMPRTNMEQAHLVAERFSKAIQALPVNFPFPVSASSGFATYPDKGDSAESLLAFADRAMYQVKSESHTIV
jgi:diguanylate cyclase (GGDEF)-like protein